MTKAVTVDLKGADRLLKDLQTLRSKAIPHAMRDAVNRTAFQARTTWVGEVRMTMTLRSTWTERSLQVEKASGTNTATMQATLGSTQPYMAEREEAHTADSRGKHGFALPTTAAAGQRGSRIRTKKVRRHLQMSAITLASSAERTPGKTRQQKNAIAIRLARKQGGGMAYLDSGKRQGIFRVTKRGKPTMIYDLTHRAPHTKANPSLGRTVEEARRTMPHMAKQALLDQLRRHRILRY